MTSPPLPGDRPALRGLLPAPLLTAALAAVAVVAAVFLVPDPAVTAVAVTGAVAAVLLCAAVTVTAYTVRSARAARARLDAVTQDVGRLLQERARLTEESRRQHERLTGELTRERARLSAELDQERNHLAETLAAERDRLTERHAADTARSAREHADELARLTGEHAAGIERIREEHTGELRGLADRHAAEVARLTREHTAERDRLSEERTRLAREQDRLTAENARLTARLRKAETARAAALSATANAAGRMQALSTGMLADLRAMEEKHHDEEVLADLLHLDHRTAQAGRLADSVAVLTGARSGRRWARPISMESILRGAMGRISGYQRVRVHSTSDAAVAGHAAEGVMHALAELLDNAANFSPPTAEVHVYVEEVPAGVIVSVEDSGLVMGETQLRRAERAVSGELAGLGGLTGTRLGLAVVGRLSQRYGLRVSYRPSARGGTGVLVLVPQDILVPPDAAPAAPVTAGGATASAPRATASARTPSVPATPAALTGALGSEAPESPADAAARALPHRRDHRAETGHVTARDGNTAGGTANGSSDGNGTGTAPADRPAPSGSARPAPSYAASRAGADLDPDPVPTHESPERDTDPPPLVLPRRRRGRTLAEAERTRPGVRDTTSRPAPTAEETKARTARFSSFRQAVRPPTPDDTADPDTGATAGPDTEAPHTPVTPKGDTTS
ncbi:ATP-binding protein [Streptomyces sp. NPDC000348]|uniref:ATP-binding protein n=1 Tax=Streptomyces sp. NPDC000348 TaxID=3364538 RepID=UPI0036955727